MHLAFEVIAMKAATVSDAQQRHDQIERAIAAGVSNGNLKRDDATELATMLKHSINTRAGSENESAAILAFEAETGMLMAKEKTFYVLQLHACRNM